MPSVDSSQPSSYDVAPIRPTRRGLLVFVLLCIGSAALFGVFRPAVHAAREAAKRAQCVNNLKQIGIALRHYHDVYGRFPAAFVPDANSKPMHSWRMAIIPFLTSATVYQEYDFNQPWDAATNMHVAKSFHADFYACPSAGRPPGSGFTNYVMIVGPKAALQGGNSTTLDQITDGLANTVIIAEIADSDIFWSEPRDLDMNAMSFQINDQTKPSISSHHPKGAVVLYADGTVKFLDDSIKPDDLRAMLTASASDNAAGKE